MKRLVNKQIIIGVSGSIAAYKTCSLVRILKESDALVHVVMTKSATEFVTPLTFQALSGNPVHTDLLDTNAEAAMGHIELARWADALVIAPASADLIARLAQGRADDLLTAICLASQAPIAIAPAMNQQMWADAATQSNIAILKDRGFNIIGPNDGSQACGDIGPGRMLEADEIALTVASLFSTQILQGVRILISAGPTREMIDPVRYISNLSSGKMGYALARAAVEAGARCMLVSGPCALATPERVERIDLTDTQQMFDAVESRMHNTDIFIACAAVSDYRPETVTTRKIKKQQDSLTMTFVKNPDIVSEVSARFAGKFIVGFAAETEDLQQHATKKLVDKKLNMVIANAVGQSETGIGADQNEVWAIWHDGSQHFERASKSQLARNLMVLIAERFSNFTAH